MEISIGGFSHGKAMLGILKGLPANFDVDIKAIKSELQRRKIGNYRSNRVNIESEHFEILSGVINGKTVGSPLSLIVYNDDYIKAENKVGADMQLFSSMLYPRPNHADFGGVIKFGFNDIAPVAEVASARDTVVRVALGSIVKGMLKSLNIEIHSEVIAIGNASFEGSDFADNSVFDKDDNRCGDIATSAKMTEVLKQAYEKGTTVGGKVKVTIKGVPAGVGSYFGLNSKLDARIASEVLSVQGVKGITFGDINDLTSKFGADVLDSFSIVKEDVGKKSGNSCSCITSGEVSDFINHMTMQGEEALKYSINTNGEETKFDEKDSIITANLNIVESETSNKKNEKEELKKTRVVRIGNSCGGIDGGMSSGADIFFTAYIKPIPTQRAVVNSYNINTLEKGAASIIRSDTSSVVPCSIILESVCAYCLLDEILKCQTDKWEDVLIRWSPLK